MRWLMDKNVSSFSPQTGMLLLRIQSEILKAANGDGTAPGDVIEYARALRVVCDVAAAHQKAVIDKLAELVTKER